MLSGSRCGSATSGGTEKTLRLNPHLPLLFSAPGHQPVLPARLVSVCSSAAAPGHACWTLFVLG